MFYKVSFYFHFQRNQTDPRPGNQGYVHSCSSGSGDSCNNQSIHDRGSNAVYRQPNPGLYSYAGYPVDHCDACMSCSSDCSSVYADGMNKSHYSKVLPRYCGHYSQGRPPSVVFPQHAPPMVLPHPPCVEHSQEDCGLCSSSHKSLQDGSYGDKSNTSHGNHPTPEYPCGEHFNTISGHCYGHNINNSSGYHSLMSPASEGSVCACARSHDGTRTIPHYNYNVQPTVDNHNQQYSSQGIYPGCQSVQNINPLLEYSNHGNHYQHEQDCDQCNHDYNIPAHNTAHIPSNTLHPVTNNSSSQHPCISDLDGKDNFENNCSQKGQENIRPDAISKQNSSLALQGYLIPPMKANHRDSSDYEQIDDLPITRNLNGSISCLN